jgi:hypothetical protein
MMIMRRSAVDYCNCASSQLNIAFLSRQNRLSSSEYAPT